MDPFWFLKLCAHVYVGSLSILSAGACHRNPEKGTGGPGTGVTGDVSHPAWLLRTIQAFLLQEQFMLSPAEPFLQS